MQACVRRDGGDGAMEEHQSGRDEQHVGKAERNNGAGSSGEVPSRGDQQVAYKGEPSEWWIVQRAEKYQPREWAQFRDYSMQ